MPDDRLLHPRLGHSEKVFQLTDLEFRIWIQYQLTADDCGVMRASAMTLQAANERLAKKPAKTVEKGLERLVSIGLLHAFEHQGRRYVCQLDWQDWQRVRYPRATVNPQPPTDVIAKCSEKTQRLFDVQSAEHRRHSGDAAEMSPSPAGAGACERLRLTATAEATANGNGERATDKPAHMGSGAMAGMLPRDHLRHKFCGRVCLHETQFEQFVRKFGGLPDLAATAVRKWATELLETWELPPLMNQPIQGNTFQWWDARWIEWQGAARAQTTERTVNRTTPEYTVWTCPHTPPCPHRLACKIVAARPA